MDLRVSCFALLTGDSTFPLPLLLYEVMGVWSNSYTATKMANSRDLNWEILSVPTWSGIP